MPTATTPEQVTDEFVQNLLAGFAYWKARALGAEAQYASCQAIVDQAILVGDPAGIYLMGQVAMQDSPHRPAGFKQVTIDQQIQASQLFAAWMNGQGVPTTGTGGGSTTRSRNRSSSARNRQGSSGSTTGAGTSTSSNAGTTTSRGRQPITDQAALDKRRAALAKARAVRSQRLAEAKAQRELAGAGATP